MAKTTPFSHDTPDDSAGFLLWKITALWRQKLATVFAQFEITQTQYAIMASLKWFEEHDEPTTQGHIGDHAKIDKMTMSKAIRQLAANGLVRRVSSSIDSRAVAVQFTSRGRKMIEGAIIAIENADKEFFCKLSASQLDEYKSLTLAVIKYNNL